MIFENFPRVTSMIIWGTKGTAEIKLTSKLPSIVSFYGLCQYFESEMSYQKSMIGEIRALEI